jgi:hypothetical protein
MLYQDFEKKLDEGEVFKYVEVNKREVECGGRYVQVI